MNQMAREFATSQGLEFTRTPLDAIPGLSVHESSAKFAWFMWDLAVSKLDKPAPMPRDLSLCEFK